MQQKLRMGLWIVATVALVWPAAGIAQEQPPKNSLNLELRVAKRTLVVAEPLQIGLTLRNQGTAPMTLDDNFDLDSEEVEVLIADISSNTAGMANQWIRFKKALRAREREKRTVTLGPGEERSLTCLLAYDTHRDDVTFSKTGRYEVRIVFHYDILDYSRKVVSNSVVIEVKEPGITDRDALTTWRNDKRLLLAIQGQTDDRDRANSAARAFKEKFPSSIYTRYAEKMLQLP